MPKELIVVKGRVIEQNRSFTPEVGEHIGAEAGAKMIKRYYDQNPDDVLAHFTGRNIIEKILAQPGCTGIRTFYALNELGIKQLVMVGVDKDGNNILKYDVKDAAGRIVSQEDGLVVDRSGMCPPSCGSAGYSLEDDSSSISWF